MPVDPKLKNFNFKLSVSVNGEKEKTYKESLSRECDRSTEGYCIAKIGEKYTVSVDVSRYHNNIDSVIAAVEGYPHLEFALLIDGRQAALSQIHPGVNRQDSDGVAEFQGHEVGDDSVQEFVFAKPKVGESAKNAKKSTYKDLGTITVLVKRARVLMTTDPEPERGDALETKRMRVPEQGKKCLSSVTRYGRPVAYVGRGHVNAKTHPKDRGDRYFNKMTLRYATEDVSRAKGIIPRDESSDEESSSEESSYESDDGTTSISGDSDSSDSSDDDDDDTTTADSSNDNEGTISTSDDSDGGDSNNDDDSDTITSYIHHDTDDSKVLAQRIRSVKAHLRGLERTLAAKKRVASEKKTKKTKTTKTTKKAKEKKKSQRRSHTEEVDVKRNIRKKAEKRMKRDSIRGKRRD